MLTNAFIMSKTKTPKNQFITTNMGTDFNHNNYIDNMISEFLKKEKMINND